MGIKLEMVLVVMIVLIISTATRVTLTNTEASTNGSHKEMEFKDTTFIEVDMDKMLAKAYSSHGIRENSILTLEDLKYQTHNIESLVADKAIYDSDILTLEGNVSMHEKEGFDYATTHARYNQKTEILEVNAPFVAKMDQNIISGSSMRYDAVKKEAQGTAIDAVVYTVEK